MKAVILLLLNIASIMAGAQAVRNDIVIDEIMADPVPQVQAFNGLPEVEFIELKNISAKTINLNGWKVSDATATATITGNFMLLPDSFVILGTMHAASLLSSFGRSIGVANFPSLDNDGELLYLTSKEGKIIHAVRYNTSWYQNAVKSMGGWTMEMIDIRNPCNGALNWVASINPTGGTPGKKNSVEAANPDRMPPALVRSYSTDSLHVILLFDEPLDSISSAMPSNYEISNDIGYAVSATALAPLFDKVILKLQHPLRNKIVYQVTTKKLSDCAGNQIGVVNNAKAGLASAPESMDIVVNEILFNPTPEGVDFVEVYNRGKKIIDLKDLYLANRSFTGSPGSLKQLSAEPHFLYPGEYLVISENSATVRKQFHAKDPGTFLEINAMPSYPDDKGTVLLLNGSGKTIDEVGYSEKWHFKLIHNFEGIALERIDYNKPSHDPGNWHSASTNTGYGTPGYQNSQFMSGPMPDAVISLTPEIFSPDNDGFDDFVTIHYNFPEPGYVCNIRIYDINGRAVKYLIQNAVCGITGYFRWDGLDERNMKLPVGIYIVISEIFNLDGKTKKFKKGLVLARRLKE